MSPEVPPEHPSSTQQRPQLQQTEGATQAIRRRRHLSRSTHINPDDQESSNALWFTSPSSRRPLKITSQPRGAARESDMPLSTPPRPSADIKYTRTGRVSKAAKGQRVHSCEECGKTYTRAEHLRRHQQNHKPGAYPCDIVGCSRSFYREDLLVRHKARHNDPLNPPSRRGSVESQTPGPNIASSLPPHSPPSPAVTRTIVDASHEMLTTVGLPPSMSEMSVPQHRSGTARYEGSMSLLQAQSIGYSPLLAPRKNFNPIAELPFSMAVNTNGPCTEYAYGAWDGSPSYSPARYDSPTNEIAYPNSGPYYEQLARTRNTSNASFYGATSVPKSPGSSGSSVAYMSQWGQNAYGAPYQPFNASSGSESSFSNTGGIYNGFVEQEFVPDMGSRSRLISAQDRDLLEQDHLILPTAPNAAAYDLHFEPAVSEGERLLSAYWTCIHPLFPIIHKPSFQLQATSPLLRAAMWALGAQALQTHEHVSKSRVIHEQCMKVLKKRTLNNTNTYRVCDMQAIILVEMYSIFKSRRPPLQFSLDFEGVYRLLASDPEALSRDVAVDPPIHTQKSSASGFLDILKKDPSCKQRLLATCYILDQHHSMFFGRKHSSCLTTPGLDLLFPTTQTEWDSSLAQAHLLLCQGQLSNMPSHDKVYTAINVVPSLEDISPTPHDTFQSQLMMAYLVDPVNGPQTLGCISDNNVEMSPILLATEQSPRTRLTFHTLMLCQQTPIRDLLAVAGESWVMAEKLGSQSDFIASQLEAHQWALGAAKTPAQTFSLQTPVQRAVYHATKILALHHEHPKTGLLFQEWGVYLAAIVLWARTYVMTGERRQQRKPRLSLSMPHHGGLDLAGANRAPPQELELNVMTLITGGEAATSAMEWKDARNVLLWAKSQLEKADIPRHNCGLTDGALDVLDKIIGKGNEIGWFGS